MQNRANWRFFPLERYLGLVGEDKFEALPKWSMVYQRYPESWKLKSVVWIEPETERKFGLMPVAWQNERAGAGEAVFWIALKSEEEYRDFPDEGETLFLIPFTPGLGEKRIQAANLTISNYLSCGTAVATASCKITIFQE